MNRILFRDLLLWLVPLTILTTISIELTNITRDLYLLSASLTLLLPFTLLPTGILLMNHFRPEFFSIKPLRYRVSLAIVLLIVVLINILGGLCREGEYSMLDQEFLFYYSVHYVGPRLLFLVCLIPFLQKRNVRISYYAGHVTVLSLLAVNLWEIRIRLLSPFFHPNDVSFFIRLVDFIALISAVVAGFYVGHLRTRRNQTR